MINLSEKYLLMIEPDKITEIANSPIEDELTSKIEFIFSKCIPSSYCFKGIHVTECKMTSDNRDWILPVDNIITNSLCIYYVKFYRHAIPQSEINKINKLYDVLKGI